MYFIRLTLHTFQFMYLHPVPDYGRMELPKHVVGK